MGAEVEWLAGAEVEWVMGAEVEWVVRQEVHQAVHQAVHSRCINRYVVGVRQRTAGGSGVVQ